MSSQRSRPLNRKQISSQANKLITESQIKDGQRSWEPEDNIIKKVQGDDKE